MKRIPSSFQMLGQTISVEVVPKKEWQYEDAVGIFNPTDNSIKLLKVRRDQLLHALWHEKIHAALYFLNHRLYSNEAFVDGLGGLLAQAEDTAK